MFLADLVLGSCTPFIFDNVMTVDGVCGSSRELRDMRLYTECFLRGYSSKAINNVVGIVFKKGLQRLLHSAHNNERFQGNKHCVTFASFPNKTRFIIT